MIYNVDVRSYKGERSLSPYWAVYIVMSKRTGYFRAGVAQDVWRRAYEHNFVKSRAGKWCWANKPVVLVWWAEAKDQSAALENEAFLRSFSRKTKLRVIEGHVDPRLPQHRVGLCNYLTPSGLWAVRPPSDQEESCVS